MENKKDAILIVSAGIMQISAIKTAKAMGLTVIATDKNPNAPGFEFCDHAVVLDSKDAQGHVAYALENKEALNIKAAFAGSDVAITVSAITNALGLPGIPLDVALRSNNKSLMKERWIKDKIPTPFGSEITTVAEAKSILKHIGFPAIVKAVDSAASRGSVKIYNDENLDIAIENAKNASTTKTALIEEYVVGNEQSVETIVWHGKHYHVGMADRQFGYYPYHIETAHYDPSGLSADVQKKIYEVVDNAADSLGIDFGPAKADMILTAKGPMILEMPARLSGGFHSQYTTPYSTGQNPIRAVMEISLGYELNESLLVPVTSKVSVCAGLFPAKGKIKEIQGVEEARQIPGVKEVIITKKSGDIIEEYIDNAKRFCWVIVAGDNKEHAEQIIENVKNTIKFIVE